MKAKISLGSGGIKGLILKHVEKAVVAVAFLIFGMLVWSATKLGGDFDLQPDKLQTTSVEADTAIREPKKGPPAEVPPWQEIAQGIKKPVPADPYEVSKTWMHRLFPGETLRGEPKVFPLEKLRASTGFGGISVSASGALTRGSGGMGSYEMEMSSDMEGSGGAGYGGNKEGRRWVVVTGLLPYKKQWVEYGNVFRNAEVKFPQRDVPSYIYYEVERAEVTLGQEPEEDAWKQLKIFKEYEDRKWAGGKPEIVHPKFLHRSGSMIPMAYPLPPLVDKEFGTEIAHEPEIPLYYEVERKEEVEEIDWDSLSPEELIEARKKFGRLGGRGSSMSGSDSGYDYQQDYGEYSDMGDMGSMGSMGDMASYDGGMGSGYSGMAVRRREIPEYQLFRFFDFTVLPGRYYQYRVRLRLMNPNHELPPQNLEDETSSEYATLETAWSDPTTVVRVSLDSRVLAGPVSVSSNVNVSPKGELGTVFFDKEDGGEVAEKYTVARGQLLNYYDVEIEEEKPKASMYSDPYSAEYGMSDMESDPYGSSTRKKKERRKREPEEPAEMVNFVTEMLILDFLGGSTLPGTDRNLKEPGRILMMDGVGNLVLQKELEDQEEYIEFFPPEVKKKPEAESPYGDEYGEMMMGSSS